MFICFYYIYSKSFGIFFNKVNSMLIYITCYDFSIVFDTVENRKMRHDMERKYTERIVEYE